MSQLTHFYVFVRSDLPLPQQIVQAVHATFEASKQHTLWDRYDDTTYSTVVLEVPNERELIRAYDRISQHVECSLFREPDLNNQATAFATEPVSEWQRKAYFSRYKLWKGGQHVVDTTAITSS